MTKTALKKFLKTGDFDALRNSEDAFSEFSKEDWSAYYAKCGEVVRDFFSSHDSGDLLKEIKQAVNSGGFDNNISVFVEVYTCEELYQRFFEANPHYFSKCQSYGDGGFYYTKFGKLRDDAQSVHQKAQKPKSDETTEQLKAQFRQYQFIEIDEFDCPVVWNFEIATAARVDAESVRLLDAVQRATAEFFRPLPYVSSSYSLH